MPKETTFDKFIRWAGVTLIVFAVLYITNYLSEVLLPFVIAWFFAYLLYPVVKFIENKLHIKVRALSIILAMGAAIAVIGGVLWLIIPPMIDQFDKLGEVLTRWLHQTTHTNNLTAMIKEWLQENQAQIEHFLKSKDFSDALKTTMPKLFSVVGQTANIIISIVASMITLLYMFFILLDYETLTANWVRIFPKKNRPFWQELMKDVERELNNYIRGQGMVALCMGIMFCIGFTIIGFPMAIGTETIQTTGAVNPIYSQAAVGHDGLYEGGVIMLDNDDIEHGNSGGPVFTLGKSNQPVVIGIVSGLDALGLRTGTATGRSRFVGRVVPISAIK